MPSLETKVELRGARGSLIPNLLLQSDYAESDVLEVLLLAATPKTIEINVTTISYIYILQDGGTTANIQIVKDGGAENWTVNKVFLLSGIDSCASLVLTADADAVVHIYIGG